MKDIPRKHLPFIRKKYKSKFELVKIEKDGQAFSDSDKIFSINTENGVVSSKEKNNLKPGSYKLTVKAITSTGIALETTLTLVLEKIAYFFSLI